ncbi:MAG: 3-deoxy-7-phosphoheptulonate synthase [Solirubrobacterales bacterium]
MKELPRHQGDRVRDRRIERAVELVSPAQIVEELPLGDEREEAVLRHRSEVASILNREDDRLLVIVGPCSVHDVDAALDYAGRLSARAQELGEDLCVTMRVYFEKPRTTVGWKGLINDPHLDGSRDVNTGLHMARSLLLEVLDLGLPIGCEFLDPITPQYISDVVAWGAIGARTTESQIHRQLASGLSMPVGFKNGTAGSIKLAVDAVRAAAEPHAFAGVDASGTPAIFYTEGNPDCHVILRGGRQHPNFDAEGVGGALELLRGAGLAERLLVDASHDNSGKDHRRQPKVAAEIGAQVAAGNRAIAGVMLESFLVGGRQDHEPGADLVYGQSITDACMDWDTTVLALDRLAAAVGERRKAA